MLTINALEVEQVATIVHLVELQTHLHKIPSDRILPAHSQVIRVHHLNPMTSDTLTHLFSLIKHAYLYIFQGTHFPLVLQLFHGTVNLSHDVVWFALAPYAQVPFCLLHRQRFGSGSVESIQRASCLRAVGQERGHPFRVRFDPRWQGHALLHEGAGWGTGGQVELAGLVHDSPVVDNEVVRHGQLVLRVSTVEAAQYFGFSAFKLLAHLPHGFLIYHCGVVRGVLREEVARKVLFKPLILSVIKERRKKKLKKVLF